MLILSRKKEESLIIEGGIEIKVLDISNGLVKLGVSAPKSVNVYRKEIYDKIIEENTAAKADSSMVFNIKAESAKKND